jgi:hypothetical protein
VVVHEGLLDRPVEARVWRSSSILGHARVAEPWANASSIVSCAKSVAFGGHTSTAMPVETLPGLARRRSRQGRR